MFSLLWVPKMDLHLMYYIGTSLEYLNRDISGSICHTNKILTDYSYLALELFRKIGFIQIKHIWKIYWSAYQISKKKSRNPGTYLSSIGWSVCPLLFLILLFCRILWLFTSRIISFCFLFLVRVFHFQQSKPRISQRNPWSSHAWFL